MRNLIVAAAVAVVMLMGAPAAAQVIVSVAPGKVRAAAETMQVSVDAAQRALELVDSAKADLTGVTSPETMLAAIETALPRIDQARSELTLLAASVRALPVVAGPDDPPELHSVEVMRIRMADFVDERRISLDVYPELANAIRAGDQEGALAAYARLKANFALPYESQALITRAMMTTVGSDRSEYAQGITLACFNEGVAAYLRGALSLFPSGESAGRMQTAIDCMSDQLVNGRAALVREAAASTGTLNQRQMQVQMASVAERGFSEIEALIPQMEEAREDVRAGLAVDQLDKNLNRFNPIMSRLVALGAEQVEINRNRGR